jgi:hypothetical protein
MYLTPAVLGTIVKTFSFYFQVALGAFRVERVRWVFSVLIVNYGLSGCDRFENEE